MATTYDEIKSFLDDQGWKYHELPAEGGILVGFKQGKDDDRPETVVIKLDEGGEFVHFFEPMRYQVPKDHEHQAAVLETLLSIQWETKMLRWEYDRNDGEIRAGIELPLEDAKLTERLFLRVLKGLVELMDQYEKRIREVIETGEDPGGIQETLSELVEQLGALLGVSSDDEEQGGNKKDDEKDDNESGDDSGNGRAQSGNNSDDVIDEI